MRRSVILALSSLPPVAAAAAVPSALSQVTGGLWEITGLPGAHAAVRQCVGDVLTFAQFEHHDRTCSRSVLSNAASSSTFSYSCGPGDFGQSEIDVITPRSLRISTQGVSQQLPFNYVLQARRVGDCAKSASSSRH
jgi:hypothetical protein